ncbi:MAG: ribbon-helix-helix protein, CopG family [Chloroflexota bacterium]
MPKAAKIAISLPEEVLFAVEKERTSSGESRSQFFRRAVEALLRCQREQDMEHRYVSAYLKMPETEEDVEAARRGAAHILAKEPWG